MNKYASQFNEIIVLAKEEKTKKKGGSMAAVLKLVQDLAEFENSIQEAMDAQEMTENRTKIEAFLQDIDRMYGILLEMAKSSIQAMRQERMSILEQPQEVLPEMPAPESAPESKSAESSTSFTKEDLAKKMEAKPKSPVVLDIPKMPKM